MEHARVPGSSTTPGRPSACVGAIGHIAFRYTDSVGTRNQFSIAAQRLACTFPCRRFADILANACARLGADVVRYSFIVVDLHHLLLAGLPAHLCENSARYNRTQNFEACGHAQSKKKMQKFVRRSALRPNQFSFSHSLGPRRMPRPASVAAAYWGPPVAEVTQPTIGACVNLTHAGNGPRWRPVSKQILPRRSKCVAAGFVKGFG
jgi:hypothetical protein